MRSALVGVVALGMLGCSGSGIPPDKAAYVGRWEAPDMMLHISPTGDVNYKRDKGSSHTSINAPIKGFAGDDFEVGVWIFTTDFKVSAPPHQDPDGRWRMTVDGVELTRFD